jgi:hypothetical protein
MPSNPQYPTTPTAPLSSPFAAILSAVMVRLAAGLRIDPAFVQPVATDDYKVTIDESLFAYVRVFGIGEPRDPALSFENAGAGRLGRPVGRRIRVYLWSRVGEDIYGSDQITLMGADPTQTVATPPTSPGQFVYEEVAFTTLDDWLPTNANGEPLTVGPLHPLPSEGSPPLRKPTDDAGLVWSALDFEVCYILAINPTEPAA